MKKLFFVMNPCAGTKKANRHLAEILAIFNRAGYQVNAYMTKCRGDGADAVAREAKNSDLIVCCGGDGTFNETVEGLFRAGVDVPIGYIPAGSTNDFANSLHLPTSVVEAAKYIVEGTPKAYDVGLFDGRHFSYVASFGAFTRTSYATSQRVKNALGHSAYILAAVRELMNIRNIHASLDLDGKKVEGDYIFGAICNSTSVAGVLTLDPKRVNMSDGLFEIMLVRKPKNMGEVMEMVHAIRDKTFHCKTMTFLSAKKVKVTMPEAVTWTLDGEEQKGAHEIEITNLYRSIRLMKKAVKK